ncbi:hypothetical protein [Nonomuraea aridisoli]|uniref:hypothetical protein n=1 Tax=Nonomuraea aridisoli TaxID=2070368 RepID=UPI0011B949D1|nr:hypothetical protein [Nonomuraea aridisoli]
MAVLLLLLLAYPTTDSDSELKLAMAFALAPFPLSAVAAGLARLPHWPAFGLLAPFAMLGVAVIQPDYDVWVLSETLAFGMLIGIPVVVGFMLTALLSLLLSEKTARPAGGDTA